MFNWRSLAITCGLALLWGYVWGLILPLPWSLFIVIPTAFVGGMLLPKRIDAWLLKRNQGDEPWKNYGKDE